MARVRGERPLSLDSLPVLREAPTATAAQMAEADRAASETFGIPVELLMENAGHQIAAATRLFVDGVAGKDIVAVCGTGNNGGDALAALRHLHGWRAKVEAYVAVPREKLRPLAALQHDVLAKLGVEVHDTSASDDDRSLVDRFRRADVIIDGLLGYSASGAPRGEVARLIGLTIASGRPVVAVDLPSGLDPETGVPLSEDTRAQLRASVTVMLALPKTGLLAPDARPFVGELVLADIGIPPEAYDDLGIDTRSVFARGDLIRMLAWTPNVRTLR